MNYRHMIGLILLFLILLGCGPGKIGYGVLLWQEEDSLLEANQLLEIYIDSNIRDTYTFTPRESKEMQEIIRWRVQFFENIKDAEDFSNRYEEYKNIYGKTMQNGLPVRENPDALSDRVYRLRLGEEVKILGRQNQQSEVGQYTGYWYEVLTKEGIKGYCFDIYLKVIDATTYNEQEETVLTQNLIKFFETSYVPDYYRNMIANNAIDLDRFKPQFGLFPDLDNKRITLVLENYQTEFNFSDISSPAKDRYIFEGTSLKLQFFRSTYINISYVKNNKEESSDFVVINDIDTIIDEEIKRRNELLSALITPSNILESSGYGRINIDETGLFQWTGFERLIPSVIPASYGSTGTVFFNHFISEQLSEHYDGVITFSFTDAPVNEYVHFLFQTRESGIQLTTLSGINPRNKIFERQSDDPVIMYFSYVGEQ